MRQNILLALDRSWFDRQMITVPAQGGKVTLIARVEAWSARDEASSMAWAAPATTSFANELVIACRGDRVAPMRQHRVLKADKTERWG